MSVSATHVLFSAAKYTVELFKPVHVDFDDLPVVSHNPVGLVLHVGKLCVYRSAKPLLARRNYLVAPQLFDCGIQLLFAVKLCVSKGLIRRPVSVQRQAVTSVFAEYHSALFSLWHFKLDKILVYTSQFSALIAPTAGMVYQSGAVKTAKILAHLQAVKLPPPSLKGVQRPMHGQL